MSSTIKRALISVYDKTGIVDFARALTGEFGIEILSTGGTAKLLKESDIPVTLVEDVTGSGEMLDGRVKTLHPKIHAAILADRDNPDHMRQLEETGIKPIDMVVVNLYPFEDTIAKPGCTFDEAIEMIDIGGPCMLRAAAKNHKHVLPISKTEQYSWCLSFLRGEEPPPEGRASFHRRLAGFAYGDISCYDDYVGMYLANSAADIEDPGWRDRDHNAPSFLESLDEMMPMTHVWLEAKPLRYGENPHQEAAYLDGDHMISRDVLVSGGMLSYNNCVDADSAIRLCAELSRGFGLQCGTGFQPVGTEQEQTSTKKLSDEKHTQRNLPHFQTPGKTYFVTFRLKEDGELNPPERDVVLGACLFWNDRKLDLHACVVMPDHVHLLFTPSEVEPGKWTPLGEILHSIKRHSAREINKLRERTGALWQDESFDRIMRNEKEFVEKADYIANNPIKAGLVDTGNYSWWWDEQDHRLKTGATLAEPTQVKPVCVFIKHTNACGAGIGEHAVDAYRCAYLGDFNAAMGGILATNFSVDEQFAELVMDTYQRWGKDAGAGGFFIEVWAAPAFSDGAVKLIRSAKKWGERVRLLQVGDDEFTESHSSCDEKFVAGGMLVQERDAVGLNEDQWKVVTKRQPTEAQWNDLRLAWLVCKHTKSNAISVCKDGMLIGNGAGQMSRVMSCRIATWLAKENGHEASLAGAVAASDAFFPFRDGPDILIDAGVQAIIQPGGSKRDEDTIAACDERDVAMIFTGTRHFKH